MSFRIPGTELTSLPIDTIEIGERYRKEYGDLSDLMHSIKTNGLINPIACTFQSDRYLLVAGGRRLEAMKRLGETECLVRVFTNDLSDLDIRILELAENLQRKDMTWAETNSLQREIHRLQQEKYGKAQAGGVSNEEKDPDVMGWRMQDTANMLGVSKSKISEGIKLADKFDQYAAVLGDPSNYKTENDARKAVKRVEETLVRAELARRVKERGSSILSTIEQSYQIGDTFTYMASHAPSTFSFIECDPPYGIALDESKKNNSCEGYCEIDEAGYPAFLERLLRECYRLLADDSFCLFWYAPEPWSELIYSIATAAGFSTKRMPMIWVKNQGQSMSPSTSLANSYETAYVLKKGSPILAKPGRINAFQYSPVLAQKKYHPTQKPLDLYKDIYETFSFEGAKCLTPFAGSGASILAAYMNHRTCIGYDISDTFKPAFIEAASQAFVEV